MFITVTFASRFSPTIVWACCGEIVNRMEGMADKFVSSLAGGPEPGAGLKEAGCAPAHADTAKVAIAAAMIPPHRRR